MTGISQIVFRADDVALDPRVGFIGFSDTTGGRYFWLQPGETADGISSRKNEIWLERDDQQWGGSGGDWTIHLSRNSLTIDTRTLPWMACETIAIQYDLDDAQYERLKALFEKVMAGCPSDLRIVSAS